MIANGMIACGSIITHNILHSMRWVVMCTAANERFCLAFVQETLWGRETGQHSIFVYLMQWNAVYATFRYDQDAFSGSFLWICFGWDNLFSLFVLVLKASCMCPDVQTSSALLLRLSWGSFWLNQACLNAYLSPGSWWSQCYHITHVAMHSIQFHWRVNT